MDLESIKLSDLSLTENDKYWVVSFICRIFKKRKEKSQTHGNRRKKSGCQELRGRGNGEIGESVPLFSYRMKSKDPICKVMTITDNTVLHN